MRACNLLTQSMPSFISGSDLLGRMKASEVILDETHPCLMGACDLLIQSMPSIETAATAQMIATCIDEVRVHKLLI